MRDVVIEVNRGMVTAVYSDRDLRVIVVDWDLDQCLDAETQFGTVLTSEDLTYLPESTKQEYHKAIA